MLALYMLVYLVSAEPSFIFQNQDILVYLEYLVDKEMTTYLI